MRWSLQENAGDAVVYVFRSTDGVGSWKLITEEPVLGSGMALDADFTLNDLAHIPYYRAVAVIAGKEYDSPIISAFESLTRSQFAAVRRIMQLEVLRMRPPQGNGLTVWHYVPLTSGDPNPAYDHVTWQQRGVECPDAADPSYGLPFKGGYAPPCMSFIEVGQRRTTEQDRPDGTGTAQSVELITARMLAFPSPARGHLLVHPANDDRWVVESVVEPYMFRGIAVIAHQVSLHLLRRSDPRYQLPVPV